MQLALSAEGQDYPSTGNYVEKFEAKFNFNSTKNTVEMGINTDVPVSTAKLNVGVQTLLKSKYVETCSFIFVRYKNYIILDNHI